MSRPETFTPPPGTYARPLSTARGDFAALVGGPASGPVRGTALLLPGFTGSKEDFIALLRPLADAGYRTVAVDGRGQHETPGPREDESAYARAELAGDVLAQAAALGPAPVHLLGHSFGGLVARTAVVTDPAPFASLTLMASGPAAVSASQQQRVTLLRDALGAFDMAQVWEALQAFEAAAGAVPRGDEEDLRRRWMNTSPAQLLAAGRQLCDEPDGIDALAPVAPPTHVLSGEEDEAWPVPLLDAMAARLSAARTVIAGAGHSPNTDRPLETSAALAAFWDGVPDRRTDDHAA
ncbi:alpha/beta fold hydrolase [Streptomyces sp. SID5785]|uniref:alpha/beta fold hydrolase n=1 Tax=Streptomyces sp. SID5785 TaxID=2690309 RepID=UPI001360BF02|nr:alpha/beta fold hydrolase [Streptomyces sp. SID5785]MZD07288.1 alpha/beta fold hydrolase [Streptomyces sp. SID5785]